jgi:predicted CXXCH cytochrome family protein
MSMLPRTLARTRRFWAAVRPRPRRGAVLSVLAITIGAAVLAVGIFAGAAIAWSPYLDFSLNRDSNAKQWAALPLSFDNSSVCIKCHEPEATKLLAAPHKNIGCQSCHGPLLEHSTEAAADPTNASGTVAVAVPTDAVCIRCHAQAVGRPTTLNHIVPAQHYVAQCLQCHNPHSGIANRPPVVQHPLDGIPACLTCHGPEGFKARNVRHPSGALTDQQCLECHAAGRGPAVSPTAAPSASGGSN